MATLPLTMLCCLLLRVTYSQQTSDVITRNDDVMFNQTRAETATCQITNCSCQFGPSQKSPGNICVNCHFLKSPNFLEELGVFLSSIDTEFVNNFTLTQTPLTIIPESICRLKSLKYLTLSHNLIDKLNPSCFYEMGNLTLLDLQNNSLSELTNGLFHELDRLQTLELQSNNIGRIGVDVFSNMSALNELSTIYLDFNNLTTIDPWPIIRLLAVPGTTVTLEHNQITHFTNLIGWHYTCNMARPRGDVYLKHNNIHHLSDIFHGWEMFSLLDIICMFLGEKFQFEIHANPYDCDCHEYNYILYFSRWGKKSHIINQLICESPKLPDLGPEPPMNKVPLKDLVCNISAGCPVNCICIQRPYNRTFHIECVDAAKKTLPLALPNRTNLADDLVYKYNLDFSRNNLSMLEDRLYLQHSSIVDLSWNHIIEIPESFLHLLQNATMIYLDTNRLRTLPKATVDLHFKAAEMSLFDNDWTCDCTTLWLKKWLLSIKPQLVNPSGILCGNPARVRNINVLQLADSEFICGDPVDHHLRDLLLICGGCIAGTVLLFLLPVLLLYVTRVWVYTKFKWHPFDWDECSGEDKLYDVFVSYADEDQLCAQELVSWLEDSKHYKCCEHKRDFRPGELILDNISQAVGCSKRILCLLSTHYLQSQFCVWEFEQAVNQDVTTRKRRVIAVKLGELPPPDELPHVLRQHISSFTYLDPSEPHFLDKLSYVMPVRRITSQDTETQIIDDTEELNAAMTNDTDQIDGAMPSDTDQIGEDMTHDTDQIDDDMTQDTDQIDEDLASDADQIDGHNTHGMDQIDDNMTHDADQIEGGMTGDTEEWRLTSDKTGLLF